jgi:hypothetical protein
LETKY